MNDETKLPKVVKTLESKHDPSGLVRPGVCNPLSTGRPGVFVATPINWPEPGSEMMYRGLRVIVDGRPTPTGKVWVCADRGAFFWVDPSDLHPIPQTQTVTFEVHADVDPRSIRLHCREGYPYSTMTVEGKLVAIDGEEVDHG